MWLLVWLLVSPLELPFVWPFAPAIVPAVGVAVCVILRAGATKAVQVIPYTEYDFDQTSGTHIKGNSTQSPCEIRYRCVRLKVPDLRRNGSTKIVPRKFQNRGTTGEVCPVQCGMAPPTKASLQAGPRLTSL